MNPISLTRLTRCVLSAALTACLLVGCAGVRPIRGKVIAGSVGQAVPAAPGDERFDQPGIPGATVTVMAKGGSAERGRGVFTTAVTDEQGEFSLSFRNGQYPRDAVQIRVTGDGIFTARSQTFLPGNGDQILCVVIPRPGYVNPNQNQEPK